MRFINLRPRCIWRVVSRRMASSTAPVEGQVVLVENRGPVRLIGINRPYVRNAVNPATAKELYSAFKDFDCESTARVAVLHGVGGTFCAGYDLKELARAGENAVLEDIEEGPAPMVALHKRNEVVVNGILLRDQVT